MTKTTDRTPTLLLSGLLFLAFLVLYGTTSAPGVDWADAGEAQFAAWNAGLSHPTGYPLYLMLGGLWSHLLALFSVPPSRAMTLFSVLLGAAASALMLPATQSLLQRSNVPAIQRLGLGCMVALAFGLTPTHWAQAQLAEVYALNSFLLILFLLALWSRTRPWLVALLLGLLLSHHRVSWLWLPGLALWWWVERRRAVPDGHGGPSLQDSTLWGRTRLAALVALPQLAYLYIPWRGPRTAYLHQRLTSTEQLNLYDGSLGVFLAHVSGSQFAGDVLAAPFSQQLLALWQSAWPNMGVGLLFAALGLLPLAGLRLADRVLLLGGATLTMLFGLAVAFGDFDTMIIPAWIALWLLAAVGVGALISKVKGRGGGALLLLLATLLLAERVIQRPPSRADLTAPRVLVEEVLSAEPPANAILLSNDRDEMMPLWYAQWVEGRRQDMLIAFPLLQPELTNIHETVEWAQQWGRPVLLTKEMRGLSVLWELEPHSGLLWIVRGPATPPSDPVEQNNLAEGLEVVGWQPSADPPGPGQSLMVEVAIEARSTLPDDLAFSLQLFNAQGAPVTQDDTGADPIFPPSQWPLNESLRLRFELTLPDPLPDGPYEWRLSSYRNDNGQITPAGDQVILGYTKMR